MKKRVLIIFLFTVFTLIACESKTTTYETGEKSDHVLPFVYSWKDRKESARYVFPFYFRWRDNVEKTCWGPIYYHNATAYSSSWLIGPLWWSSNHETDESSYCPSPAFHTVLADPRNIY